MQEAGCDQQRTDRARIGFGMGSRRKAMTLERLAVTFTVSAAAVLAIAGCSKTEEKRTDTPKTTEAAETPPTAEAPAQAPAAATANERFAVITHGSSGDAFWDVVKKGAEQAATDLDVAVAYQSSGDAAQQADLINAAVADKVSGLVVSMANPDALAEPIKKAVAVGIPVITINSGQGKSKEFGALAHVGQDEFIAGEGAGARLAEAGVKKLLCVIHEAG